MTEILIVAGEASGDRYGARLVEALRAVEDGPLGFFGTGGDAMAAAGVDLLCHVRDLASIGPREALAHFQTYFRTFHELVRAALDRRPAAAVLIDFPEFNLRLARKLKRAGVRVIYYISPQIWAWRGGRIRTIRRCVDEMLVILPFEEQYYRSRGVAARFVGHPLLEDFSSEPSPEPLRSKLGLDPNRPVVALLPGSRRQEVEHILPVLLDAAVAVGRKLPAQFVVSAAPSVELGLVRRLAANALGTAACSPDFRIATCAARDLLAAADFALVKSGTSTLEAALVGTPFAIVYRISPLSWRAGNFLIRTPFKGLVNLIAGEEIVPEYLQDDATPETLARVVLDFLGNPEKSAAMRRRLSRVRDALTARRASESAAAAIREHLGVRHTQAPGRPEALARPEAR